MPQQRQHRHVLCTVLHTDLGDPTLQGNPFRTIHRHHSPCADSHRNAECSVAASTFCFAWGISASDLLLVPIRAAGDSTAPKWRCVERRAAPAPMQWHTYAHAPCAAGRARCAHRTPRCRKKGWAADTHTPNSPSLLGGTTTEIRAPMVEVHTETSSRTTAL